MGVLTHLLTAHAGYATAKGAASSDGSFTNARVVVALTLLRSSVIAGLNTSVLGNLRAAPVARREG